MGNFLKKRTERTVFGLLAGWTLLGSAAFAEEIELNVFAAASMTETLTQIQELYREVAPEVTVTYTFDSSGTLKTQIEEGAPCDLFISAAQKQMDQLDLEADPKSNPEGMDFVDGDTRADILENKVVLAVPQGNPADIQSFEELGSDKLSLLCLGNEDVPVGAYSLEILESLSLLEELEKEQKITYGSNVKEVTTQVEQGIVDAGIIYATDAFSAGLTVVDEADSGQCRPVIYPAAVLKTSEHPKEARDFLDFLRTPECREIFETVGFTAIEAD